MPSLAAQVDALLDRGDMWGYLIDGHGLYAWGRDMAEARRHLEAFEFLRSEEHTSELQSLMRISYAVFCLKKKTDNNTIQYIKYTIIHNMTQGTNQITTK